MANRVLTVLGIFSCVVLAGAAVWLGGLNQDEGWYLYAANLVAEGKTLYADFAYTQGPVMPIVYSVFAGIWKSWGLLGARLFTVALGLAGVLFAALTARRLVDAKSVRVGSAPNVAALIVFLLLGSNLYHLYYLAIPKTYALASLFVTLGFYLLTFLRDERAAVRLACVALSGVSLALAAGTRISLGALLAVVGVGLLIDAKSVRVGRLPVLWFGLGGGLALALIYGGLLLCPATREGLLAAQKYHAARGGFDLVFAVGSLSRLVRWYLPVFILLGLGVAKRAASRASDGTSGTAGTSGTVFAPGCGLLLASFLAVFAVQMLAPFPYEDYQVPVMALLAIYAAVVLVDAKSVRVAPVDAKSVRVAPVDAKSVRVEPVDAKSVRVEEDESIHCRPRPQTSPSPSTFPLLLLTLGLAWASSFGSPLLEKWMTNGQDRFWSIKKAQSELAQLRDVARRIEALDPGGKELLTQDLYLAIEANRKVPKGLEMGPFSILSDAEWRKLLASAPCRVAALSGYSFAVNPPVCDERPLKDQLDYWGILRKNYALSFQEPSFGQNATTLLVLERK